MLQKNLITKKMTTLHWEDNYTLKVKIKWPFMLFSLNDQISLQNDRQVQQEFQFGPNHDVYESMNEYLSNVADEQEEIYNILTFTFARKMNQKVALSEMLKVKLTDAVIDQSNGEEMPDGKTVKVHQVIVQEQSGDDKQKVFKSQARNALTGNFIISESLEFVFVFLFFSHQIFISFNYTTNIFFSI